MGKLLEIRLQDKYDGIREFVVKDGRKTVAKITESASRPICDRFQIAMSGCAYYRSTGPEAAEFIRASVEQRLQAFGGGGTETARIRGLEVFGA